MPKDRFDYVVLSWSAVVRKDDAEQLANELLQRVNDIGVYDFGTDTRTLTKNEYAEACENGNPDEFQG